MKVKFFTGSTIKILEAEINGWLATKGIGPSDLYRVCQTEDKTSYTISIWYLQLKTIQAS